MALDTSTPSVQLYAVRDALAADLEATLDRLAGIGLHQVEAFAFTENAPALRAALDRAGLAAPTGHASFLEAEEAEPALAAAKELGIELLIDPFTLPERWADADEVRRLAERANEVAELAATMGLAVGYHNHFWETAARLDGRHALEVFAEALEPGVALEVDTFWAAFGGADAPALLRRLGDRVRALHVKDGVLPAEPPALTNDLGAMMAVMGPITAQQQPAGSGEVDVLASLEAAPGALRVIEFDDYAGDVLDGIAASFAWLAEHDA